MALCTFFLCSCIILHIFSLKKSSSQGPFSHMCQWFQPEDTLTSGGQIPLCNKPRKNHVNNFLFLDFKTGFKPSLPSID